MKFGKQIQAQQVPGWSAYYLDYKFLKKIISSLAAHRPAAESAALALGVRPSDIFAHPPAPSPAPTSAPADPAPDEPPLIATSRQDDDRGPDFQAHKTAFFFKLQRELEKINTFYLSKEAELTTRLDTLLSKRQAAALRGLPDAGDDVAATLRHVEWSAVEEGFRLLERDLGKLQQFIELNATGFRKILKKWDKRSRSTTKELYLARQVEVQPVFNRQLITELSDTVASCLIDLTDPASVFKTDGAHPSPLLPLLPPHLGFDGRVVTGPYYELEHDLQKAVDARDRTTVRELVQRLGALSAQQGQGNVNFITRVLWKAVVEAPLDLADLILHTASAAAPFDFAYVDDINGRTCLHEAAAAGAARLVEMCIGEGVPADRLDVYGRSPLHYAAMRGHADICRRLLMVSSSSPSQVVSADVDGQSPLAYATLGGSIECVRVLLDSEEADAGRQHGLVNAVSANTTPLALASQHGHADIVSLLLARGAARSIANTNGELPVHLAAREGHAGVCALLLQRGGEGAGAGEDEWDVPDKYHEWTPLFHAARHGHAGVVDVLLGAGSRPGPQDEFGHQPIHYAAWFGHRLCVERLLAAAPSVREDDDAMVADENEDEEEEDEDEDGDEDEYVDIDTIPSLSLPPPIMPHRVYGHNYLDKNVLVEVAIRGQSQNGAQPGVRLRPRLMGSIMANDQRYTSGSGSGSGSGSNSASGVGAGVGSIPGSGGLRMVVTPTGAGVSAVPYTFAVPQRNERDVFVFQAPAAGVGAAALEFTLYPSFGTKIVGRAVVLPAVFESAVAGGGGTWTVPILDTRLHVVGEVSFDVTVTTPYRGVTLEVGGVVETYWKSVAASASSQPSASAFGTMAMATAAVGHHHHHQQHQSHSQSPRSLSSIHTSPSLSLTPSGDGGGGAQHNANAGASNAPLITVSSLTGTYVHVVVQVTQDYCPVVYTGWRLPESGYDVGMADVTIAQFGALAGRLGLGLDYGSGAEVGKGLARPTAAHEWPGFVARAMVSLAELLQILPAHLGLTIEVALATSAARSPEFRRRSLDVNRCVDALISCIHQTKTSTPVMGSVEGGQYQEQASSPYTSRRRVAFTSFSPRTCVALNWKQPNYPVFFASRCDDRSSSSLPSTATTDPMSMSTSMPAPTPPRLPDTDELRDHLEDVGGYWSSSVSAGVEFARMNNLLGVFFDGDLVLQIPSLIKGIRDAGLLLGVYGSTQQQQQSNLAGPPTDGGGLNVNTNSSAVDACIKDGVVVYMDYLNRE